MDNQKHTPEEQVDWLLAGENYRDEFVKLFREKRELLQENERLKKHNEWLEEGNSLTESERNAELVLRIKKLEGLLKRAEPYDDYSDDYFVAKKENEQLTKINNDAINTVQSLKQRIEELEQEKDNAQRDYVYWKLEYDSLVTRFKNLDLENHMQAEQIKKLEGLLKDIDDFFGGEQLYKEHSKTYNLILRIKAALKL